MHAAIRQLAYGTMSDAMEEYLHMSETVGRETLRTFYECRLKATYKKYTRCINKDMIFPGFLVVSIAPHTGLGKPTQLLGKVNIIGVIMMAQQLCLRRLHHLIFGYDMCFCGMSGANNDVAVINVSPISDRLIDGVELNTSFSMKMSTMNTDII
ncbi:uncharacterized protein LOC143560505 [Bidens hawaiensis]|uniref:uncharacterized protein LOC143560505 n=1 Tax=Bidens hawaiensis TaxID=980011 RepID=UPI00404B5FA6